MVLGPGPAYAPLWIRLLGHSDILSAPWNRALHEGSHPLIVCAKGGHTSELMTVRQRARRGEYVEQESWSGGMVRRPGGRRTPSGELVMLGQKTRPLPGMEWVQYSGLWGEREEPGLFSWYRSGYWGPAFNETGVRNGFIAAWCAGMAASPVPVGQECHAPQTVP